MTSMTGSALELDHCKRMVARLTTLHHTVERLHAATRRADVARVVDDVVVKTLDGKDCAIYELDSTGEELRLVSVTSPDLGIPRVVKPGTGLIGHPVASGRSFINNMSRIGCAPWERTLRACIPVKFCGRVTGVIAIFGLEASKKDFAPLDLEVFDVLSRHVAVALHTTAANEPERNNRN